MKKIYKLYAVIEKEIMIEGTYNSDYLPMASNYTVLKYLSADHDIQNLRNDMKNYSFKEYTILETYEL